MRRIAGLLLAMALAPPVQAEVFRLQSPLPLPVTIRILGPAPEFPQVVMVPAAPGSVLVPFPQTRMQVQVQLAPGIWSHVVSLTQRPKIQRLPNLF